MKKSIIACALIGSLAVAGTANAVEPISYSTLDLGYTRADVDGDSATGASVNIRAALGEAWFLGLDTTWFDDNFRGLDFETSEISGGVGYALRPSETSSFYWQANLLRVNADVSIPGLRSRDISETGQELRLGWRMAAGTQLEGEIAVHHQILGDRFDDQTYVAVGGHYYVTDSVGLGLEGQFGRDSDTVSAFVRLRF